MTATILNRETFKTDRALEFFSEKELQMQIGHPRQLWPLAIVKELIDNSLDACETARILPEIEVTVNEDFVSVQDNGPGLAVKTLKHSLNYMIRVSDKSHYVSPTRGQLGNALKCVWAVPFVLNGEQGLIDVVTGGKLHRIEVTLDRIEQKPKLKHTISNDGFVKNGTFVKIYLPGIASILEGEELRISYNFIQGIMTLIQAYSALNSRATFIYNGIDCNFTFERSVEDWSKWLPSMPTSAWWYTTERFRSLIAGYVSISRTGGNPKTVREFVSEFKGLTSTAKQKLVTESVGLSRACLSDLVENDDVNFEMAESLLNAMKDNSAVVKPNALGVIGEDHLKKCMSEGGVGGGSVKYKKVHGIAKDMPFVLEASFGVLENEDLGMDYVAGLNWTPAIKTPFEELLSILIDVHIDPYDPVRLVVHLAFQ